MLRVALTPGSIGRRYSPLIVLAAVQLLLVVISPSTPPKSTDVAAGSNGAIASSDNGGATGDTGSVAGGSNGTSGGGANGTSGGASGGSSGGGATAAGGGSARGGGGGGAAGASNTADRSKCGPDGKQIGPTFYMPPCAPVWHGGDNGGNTMNGVNATAINYLYYRAQGNAEVNAILAREDLAATDDQFCAAIATFNTEINKRWEFYGRKMVSMDGPGNHSGNAVGNANGNSCHTNYYQGQCSLTPPAPDCERAEADQIASMHPAIVIAPTADPAFYNQLGKDHVLVAGGEDEPDSYHQAVAPYYWDIFRNGNRIADMLAEYYCKQLNNKQPKFAGTDVNGAVGYPTVRKVAILYPATNGDPTFRIGADEFIKQLTGGMCNSPGGVTKFEYQSDITTAEQQSNSTVAGLISDHITTVVCYCDPIAPVFLTNTMDANHYHPEQLMTGSGLIDYDALAQLYNTNVWNHAFGLSELTDPIPFDQSDAVAAWHDAGQQGLPDKTENLNWAYFTFMASGFQMAGAKPNVNAYKNGYFTGPPEGGDHIHALIAFGHPNDYTGIKDARQVWYCSSKPSPINGNNGTYVSLEGGKRRQLGEFQSGDPAMFPNGFCS